MLFINGPVVLRAVRNILEEFAGVLHNVLKQLCSDIVADSDLCVKYRRMEMVSRVHVVTRIYRFQYTKLTYEANTTYVQ